jgi:hypothetical protein
MEQEVCQLLLAASYEKKVFTSGKTTKLAVFIEFVSTKEITLVDAIRLRSGKAAN